MANITYSRTFTHDDWIDNEDVVQAGGEKGFNQKFHGIEAEFDRLAQAIQQIDTALTALQGGPPPRELKATYTPILVTIASAGWSHAQGLAQKPPGATSAHGMMSVDLPHGVTLRFFRATGKNESSSAPGTPGSGNLRLSLRRQSVDAATTDLIGRLDGSGSSFDENVAIDAQFAPVDTTRFKYFFTAELNNAAGADTVQLFAFQITYMST